MAAPGGARRQPLLLLLLAGLVYGTSAVFLEVKDGNGTACIMANFSAEFVTNYDTQSGSKNSTFTLPPNAEVLNSSSCGKGNASNPSLMIAFGNGHILTLSFARNATRYSVQMMRFVYNLSDTHIFPNASSQGPKTAESITDIMADINKKYRCVSSNQIHMNNVTVTFIDATIQAYLSTDSFSKEETRCMQDKPSPTVTPTSAHPSSTPPHPSPTSAHPSSSPPHPTPPHPSPPHPSPTPPHPSPSPVPENPSVHKYNVSGTNGTCLLANMGLQLNVTYKKKDDKTMTRVFNINPNNTKAGGSCTTQLVTLELQSENSTFLAFQFGMNSSSSRFFLKEIQLSMTLPDAKEPTFKASNNSLRALQATMGNSYKCNAEEHIWVTDAFSVNLFKVWVQAFQVEGDKFGSVEECQLDENNMLIPIAVGGALAGLVLIVLIAYLIGRKRSHAGYQTI
ncbi:lysosome-associated membrane glycoprotein 1 isoform X1 [Pipistrellus kuhlii]|uniref:Lysosome-associated membrane glycoprotein 1 n=1 Tax=Pipistrellus kuhlii TaxID=59472 RepID=A0A7J7ZJ64_PIPKU|nr:lysosome-associated membrane glycoprotein 1 isoform X1 [Pipistrellus kuhlii]KAF6374075.1 lysosomal associated membrane protein 1 [Pipistrellus kuhlii]